MASSARTIPRGLALCAVILVPEQGFAEDMPGLVPASRAGAVTCLFDRRCVSGKACESQSLTGEIRVGEGSLFSQEATLTIGEERIYLNPPLIEGGDWINAAFVTFTGTSGYVFPDAAASWLLTRTASGDTVYTVHFRKEPRAVTWHGICNEAAS